MPGAWLLGTNAVVGQLTRTRDHPDPATYLGAGKVEELRRLVEDNLKDATAVRVVDRTALILDIFAEHARSAEGKELPPAVLAAGTRTARG
jgi:GTP-binding protein HflX